jgi:hypothetical protein
MATFPQRGNRLPSHTREIRDDDFSDVTVDPVDIRLKFLLNDRRQLRELVLEFGIGISERSGGPER